MIYDSEGEVLAELASYVQPGQCIVEIGSYTGNSALYLARDSSPEVPIFCIDLWHTKGPNDKRKPKFRDPEVYKTFRTRTKSITRITPIIGASTEIAKAFTRRIGLLYIDGGHSTAEALRDFEAWYPCVAMFGVVVFHDAEPGGKVAAAIEQIRAKYGEVFPVWQQQDRLAMSARGATPT